MDVIFGVISTLFSVLAVGTYLWAVKQRTTLVSLGAGVLFSVNTLLALYKTQGLMENEWLSPELVGLWFFALGNIVVVMVASIMRQYAPWKTADSIFVSLAMGLLVAYALIDSSRITLGLSVGLETLGSLWVIHKMYRHPNQEAIVPWVYSLVGYGVALLGQLWEGHEAEKIWFSAIVTLNISSVVVLGIYQRVRKSPIVT